MKLLYPQPLSDAVGLVYCLQVFQVAPGRSEDGRALHQGLPERALVFWRICGRELPADRDGFVGGCQGVCGPVELGVASPEIAERCGEAPAHADGNVTGLQAAVDRDRFLEDLARRLPIRR